MIERHVSFDVIPDQTQAFETFFIKEYRPSMARIPGFIKVELLREQEKPTVYQLVIRFDSNEAAAAWRGSPQHQALSPKLNALHLGSQLLVYEVIA